jgi:hypothetical protein
LLVLYTWALLVIKARSGVEADRPIDVPAPRIRLPEPTTVIENDQHVTVLNEAFAAV